tara:strand:- start:5730 stop:6302 length:573 start_codon:yes stop_codon:yes gene_type:complete
MTNTLNNSNLFKVNKKITSLEEDNNIKNENDTYELDNNYTLWYHNPNDTNWNTDSYHQIITISTIPEFWILNTFINKDMIINGMFFLMRDDIIPIWENNENKNGGYISWKISNDKAYDTWIDLCGHILTNEFNINQFINGISISPKKYFNIIKIWTNSPINVSDIKMPENFILKNEKPIFKLHNKNLEKK